MPDGLQRQQLHAHEKQLQDCLGGWSRGARQSGPTATPRRCCRRSRSAGRLSRPSGAAAPPGGPPPCPPAARPAAPCSLPDPRTVTTLLNQMGKCGYKECLKYNNSGPRPPTDPARGNIRNAARRNVVNYFYPRSIRGSNIYLLACGSSHCFASLWLLPVHIRPKHPEDANQDLSDLQEATWLRS